MFDQATKRERRRRWLSVTLDGEFRLDDEVAAICGPVAGRIANQANAHGYVRYVEAVAEQVGALCGTATGLTADAKLRGLDGADRTRARDALRTVTRASVPPVTADMLADGSWIEPLVALARRDTDALARLLGHQKRDMRGGESASDTLIAALRGLDRAVLDTHRRIDSAEFWRQQRTTATTPRVADAQMARDVLTELGIDETTATKESTS